jgi:hypothetical protein
LAGPDEVGADEVEVAIVDDLKNDLEVKDDIFMPAEQGMTYCWCLKLSSYLYLTWTKVLC